MIVQDFLKEKKELEIKIDTLIADFFQRLKSEKVEIADFKLCNTNFYNEGKKVISVLSDVEITI